MHEACSAGNVLRLIERMNSEDESSPYLVSSLTSYPLKGITVRGESV